MQNLKPFLKPMDIEPIKINNRINDDIDTIIYNTNLEEIRIRGIVEIINGDNKIKTNNKMVQSLLAWFANMTSMHHVYIDNGSVGFWRIGTYNWKMYLGTNTTTPTAYNTAVLTNPIGTSPGTAPNTLTGTTSNPSNGVFNVMFSATWYAGTVSGTIGEIALYLNVRNTLQGFGWSLDTNNTYPTETLQLVSRLAAADGTFSPFTINTANPLTINWTVQLSFS